MQNVHWQIPGTDQSISISGLVVEYIVAIDVTRDRFPADALQIAKSIMARRSSGMVIAAPMATEHGQCGQQFLAKTLPCVCVCPMYGGVAEYVLLGQVRSLRAERFELPTF